MILPSRELVPVIRAALQRGQQVRMIATGNSMLPFIHDGDIIELSAPISELRLGDIVLAEYPGGQHVVHRVVHLEDNTYILRGDAQVESEGPLTNDNVLANVNASHRHRSIRVHDHGFWRLAGLAWLHSAPLGYHMLHLVLPLWQLGKRARNWLQPEKEHKSTNSPRPEILPEP